MSISPPSSFPSPPLDPTSIDITHIPKKSHTGHVEVAGKVYKVIITLKGTPSDDEVKEAWKATTAKVKDLIQAFKLGERDEETKTTTKRLRIEGGLAEGKVVREYVNDSETKIYTTVHSREEVAKLVEKTAVLVHNTATGLIHPSTETKGLAPSNGPVPNSAQENEHKQPPNQPQASQPLENLAATVTPLGQQALNPNNQSLTTIEAEEEEEEEADAQSHTTTPSTNIVLEDDTHPQPPPISQPIPLSIPIPIANPSITSSAGPLPTIALPPNASTTETKETKRAPVVDMSATTTPASTLFSTAASALSKPSLAAAPSPPGEPVKIQAFYDHHGKLVAIDQAVRNETVPLYLRSLQTQERALEKEINLQSNIFDKQNNPYNWGVHDHDVVEPLRLKLAQVKAKIINCQEQRANGATWASTNSPRFAFRNNQGSNPKNDALPVLINSHMQVLKTEEGTIVSAVSSSGTISDFTNGEVSLQELQDYNDIIKFSSKIPTPLERDRYEYLAKLYGLREYPQKMQEWSALGARIEKAAVAAYGDKISGGPSKKKIDPEKLENVIEERQGRLEHMFLQDLYQHLALRKADRGAIVYGRIGLLDMQKKPKVEGAVLYERSQGLDTKAILDKYDGREIIFDKDLKEGDGPYIDNEGRIHMPPECAAPGITSSRLETMYFNISAQGHTKNEGPQKQINQDALDKLRKKDPTAAGDLERALDNLSRGQGLPSEAAQLALNAVQDFGYAAVNCYGGKDRTGALIIRNTREHLAQLITYASTGAPEVKSIAVVEREPLLERWSKEMLNPAGTRPKIAKENADHFVLKVQGGIVGRELTIYKNNRMQRIKDAFQAAKLSVKALFSAKIGRMAQISPIAGQLYGPAPKAAANIEAKTEAETESKYGPSESKTT